MISKVKKIVKKLLGIQPQPEAPVLGIAEKRLQELIEMEQEMLERKQFVLRQRGANEAAKKLLHSMEANGLLPYQVKKLEAEFCLEDLEFSAQFRRILNGEDED